jgi:hypothetical protein
MLFKVQSSRFNVSVTEESLDVECRAVSLCTKDAVFSNTNIGSERSSLGS